MARSPEQFKRLSRLDRERLRAALTTADRLTGATAARATRRRRSLRLMQTILHHNAPDLVTMVELTTHVLESAG